MSVIMSHDFTVRRQTLIELGIRTEKLIALAVQDGYLVKRDLTRNKAFPNVAGYKIIHADPIRDKQEGAVYYVDFFPHQGHLIFSQGSTPLNLRAVYRVGKS